MGVDLYRFIYDRITDSETVEMIRRCLAQGVVLDTWMNSDEGEQVSPAAEAELTKEQERLTAVAMRLRSVFPHFPMPEAYVNSVFQELLFSTALYVAQQKKGRRNVDLPEAEQAIMRLSKFVAAEPEGLMAAAGFFFVVSAYEDLNAIEFYGRMKKEDFLLGTLHRPWSNLILSAQLDSYLRMRLVECTFTGDGDMLHLTELGRDVLDRLRDTLDDAGELKWRAESQRWVIFGEMDYDAVFSHVLPDFNQQTEAYLKSLGIREGMRVLEVGCGTGRATVDLGLCDLVGPSGHVVALDPSAVLLDKLKAKCRERNISNVEAVQGRGEELPFLDGSFDAAIAVLSLHFTDVDQAVSEMTRVTTKGGFVSALCPAPEADAREIPMVALWFRPLSDMAERFGVPFSERNGLPHGLLHKAFTEHLTEIEMRDVPGTASAEDYQSFLAFFLRGAALFQNILCRLPFRERWGLIRRLEVEGAEIAASTSPEEKQAVYYAEAAYGKVR